MPHVVFRTDASLDIGTGHAMRCLTVAEALRTYGVGSTFICRALPGNLIEGIRARGFDALALPTARPPADLLDAVPHAAWLGVDQQTDATQSAAALANLAERPDWLLVDHYALDARWERAMRPACRAIAAVDDLADRVHECDLLLDQNIGREPADYAALLPAGCDIMAGTMFALLKPAFAELRPSSLDRRVQTPVRELLVSLGGIDKDNATGAVLAGLGHCDLPPDLTVTVVMGASAPWLAAVEAQAAALPWRADIAVDVRDMAALMARADIAIGAAGTTTWERCCLGLPSIVFGTAENQRYVIGQLADRNVAVIGDLKKLTTDPAQLAPLMARLMSERLAYSRRAAALTDGRGCEMLINRLFPALSTGMTTA